MLAHRTPDPAAMNAARVVTLMLQSRSPPVPTRSTAASTSFCASGHGTAASTMARASPVTSSAVSPLACNRTRKAPPGSAWPHRSQPSSGSLRPPRHSATPAGSSGTELRARSVPPQVPLEDTRAISPSCTWDVPSTIVSCLASRYHCSVGWSSMYPAAPSSWTASDEARTASSSRGIWPWTGRGRIPW